MFTTLFYLIISAMLGACILIFLLLAARALHFRRKIADIHGFTEGILTGAAYPLLVSVLALLFVQFLSFIILKPTSELQYCIRTGLYLATFASFFIARSYTPPLLAYWFDKSGLWNGLSEKNKIPYSYIYCATLSKNCNPDLINTQRLCKFSFYVKNKTKHGLPKKFICKITAFELNALRRQIDIRPYSDAKAVKKAQLHKGRLCTALPFVKAFCVISLAMLIFSSGILYTPRYNKSEFKSYEPINTVTQISSVQTNQNTVCIYYEKIDCASFYSTDGSFLFSIMLPRSPLAQTDIRMSDGKIYFLCANTVSIYELSNGALISSCNISECSGIFENPISSEYSTDGLSVFKYTENGDRSYLLRREPYLFALSFNYCWWAFALSLSAIFILKFMISDRTPPKPKKQKMTA